MNSNLLPLCQRNVSEHAIVTINPFDFFHKVTGSNIGKSIANTCNANCLLGAAILSALYILMHFILIITLRGTIIILILQKRKVGTEELNNTQALQLRKR